MIKGDTVYIIRHWNGAGRMRLTEATIESRGKVKMTLRNSFGEMFEKWLRPAAYCDSHQMFPADTYTKEDAQNFALQIGQVSYDEYDRDESPRFEEQRASGKDWCKRHIARHDEYIKEGVAVAWTKTHAESILDFDNEWLTK